MRDYIHVCDLADAHVKALHLLAQQSTQNTAYKLNLGTGVGYSVKQVVDTACAIVGKAIPTVFGDRRPGDPPMLVANPQKAQQLLGWQATCSDLETILKTALHSMDLNIAI